MEFVRWKSIRRTNPFILGRVGAKCGKVSRNNFLLVCTWINCLLDTHTTVLEVKRWVVAGTCAACSLLKMAADSAWKIQSFLSFLLERRCSLSKRLLSTTEVEELAALACASEFSNFPTRLQQEGGHGGNQWIYSLYAFVSVWINVVELAVNAYYSACKLEV